MKVIIDRFEGDFAVCEKEDRTLINIEKSKLPCEAKTGDVLLVEENKITIDLNKTNERKKHIKQMMNDLWE